MRSNPLLKSLLSVKTTIVDQLAHRSNRFYIPDWNTPFTSVGPRGKHYKPDVMKRMAKHGLQTRLETSGGKKILWRKIIKGPKGWTQFVAAP